MGESLCPIAEAHFEKAPYSLSVNGIGDLFAVYSGAYMLTALPVGFLVDCACAWRGGEPRIAGRLLKLMMSCGALGAAVSLVLLGPIATLVSSEAALPLAAVGLAGLGTSTAFWIIPSLPDMNLGIAEDDEASRNAVASGWTGVYSGGGGAGAVLGSLIYARNGFDSLCYVMLVGAAATWAAMLAWLVSSSQRWPARPRGPLMPASTTRVATEPLLHVNVCGPQSPGS